MKNNLIKEHLFKISGNNLISGFEIQNVDKDKTPNELNAKILFDLWDIALKFGTVGSEGLGIKIGYSDFRLVVVLNNGVQTGGVNGMTITQSSGQSISIIKQPIFMKLNNGVNVIWSNTLNIDDICRTIIETNKMAKSNGLMIGNVRKMQLIPSTAN